MCRIIFIPVQWSVSKSHELAEISFNPIFVAILIAIFPYDQDNDCHVGGMYISVLTFLKTIIEKYQ